MVWVRPALSEKVLPSLAIFWKGCWVSGVSPGWSPRAAPPARVAFTLPSTAARASPLRVWGGITRGRACLSSRRCCGAAVWFRLCGGWGRGPACAAHPPPSPARVAVEWGVGRRRWAPGSQPSPVLHPCLPSRASLPLASTTLAAPATRPCAVCGACRVLSGFVRVAASSPPLPRQRSHGWRNCGNVLPLLHGAEVVCVWRDGFSLSGAGRCVGERLLAASGASSDAGTHCRSCVFVGRHRCVSASVSLA